MQCPFCYVIKNNNVLTFETAKAAIEKYNPQVIVFHGGEPLLHPELLIKIMNEFSDRDFSITSNMTLPLTDVRIEVLSRCNIATSYSIDRFSGNKTSWNTFVSNVKRIKPPFTLLVTLSIPQMEIAPEELVKTISQIPYSNVLFERLYTDNANNELALKTDEYLSRLMDLIPYGKNILYQQMGNAAKNNCQVFSTSCNKSVVTVNADGSIQHCPNAKYLFKVRKRECLSCEVYQYCRGDCMSYQEACMFPKQTFLKIKEKIKYGHGDRSTHCN